MRKRVTAMDSRWTAEQLAAITQKDCSLLVAAAAGAGKTAVLVERIIRKITDSVKPVDIDRLLIVTFTNAAATEMRERIAAAISGAIERGDGGEDGQRQLQRQLALLSRASITTIHSFCMEVIKNNFQYIKLDPDFRISDETEAVLMKLEVMEELFEDMYSSEAPDEEFLELVECYGGGRDDVQLQNMVMMLHEFTGSCPWPRIWLEKNVEAFNISSGCDFGATVWAEILVKSAEIELRGLYAGMRDAVDIIQDSQGLSPYLKNFAEEASQLDCLIKKLSAAGSGDVSVPWDGLPEAFASVEFGRLPRCGKDADAAMQEKVRQIRDEVKKRLKKLAGDIFAESSQDIIKDLNHMYPLLKRLSALVLEFGRRYSEKKREKALLDFNDLEHFCLEILTQPLEAGEPENGQTDFMGFPIKPSGIAEIYRERFEEILVDEYQDSNMVQEVIIGMVSRSGSDTPNVFMVGDVKQSIYRFRQAKPELFLEKYDSYSASEGAAKRKIMLYKNFRSRREVVDGVNYIFKQIMSKDIGELDYNDAEALNPGASFPENQDELAATGGEAELHIIDTGGGWEDRQDTGALGDETPEEEEEGTNQNVPEEEQPDNIQCEARIIAARIKELMSPAHGERVFKVMDSKTGGYRKLEYRDIVILLRATRNWADIFAEELTAQGIPAYTDSGMGYFKTVEVQVVISLLQIIDNPLQDIPLLSVLRSPIAGFASEELIDIRLADREMPLYDAMKKLVENETGKTAQKAVSFIENLDRWRDRAQYMPTDELIWYLYTDTGYYSFAGAMPGGAQRQANLRVLFERARQYEQTSYKGLFNFISFINKLKSSSGDMGSAKTLSENENVVRIMSIHKSKGLEFPVVIVAGCGKGFNMMDLNRKLLLHQDLGFGPDLIDCVRRICYPTMAKQALKYKTRLESLSEEMRILYVAFTRAREKLIITGTVPDIKKSVSKWSAALKEEHIKLPRYDILKAKNYMDWIGFSLMRHKGCVYLRALAGAENDGTAYAIEDSSRWKIRVWSKTDAAMGSSSEEQPKRGMELFSEWQGDNGFGSEFSEEIARRLEWQYAYNQASRLPTKVSVTELKRRFDTELSEEYGALWSYTPPLVKTPRFLEERKGLTSAEKGTVLHFVMQHIDLLRISGAEDIKAQIRQMEERDLLTPEQAKTVNVTKIYSFLNSPLGMRMRKSAQINREVPFNIEISCRQVYKELSEQLCGDETILLQGVIDCWFEEDEGMVLLDYKTDYVPEGGIELIKERYRTQINYYTAALEKLTGREVKEKYIYLFSTGEVIEY
ncbi:DNA helicase/exodeoxyribonuclease V subunit A [Anaerobacterium chartisolvens]|uniref:ATP-dependent helicase/nuclease subunit A n=1 Tax=Anaerobacterium chartisolvens TaxID=1297424 RepID=A0A369AL45_9FIRM|nr:helicase-exonuclease AddAB subunit AddA [Anaerobacterium chartisolvens]RCX09891.1 DNA helicase/exodeoxyribonuclease V subunit A [Anaerobacterium chartisolvens]